MVTRRAKPEGAQSNEAHMMNPEPSVSTSEMVERVAMTLDQLNDLKHQAVLLRVAADERSRSLSENRAGLPSGYAIRDQHMDAIAKFAEAVVAILEGDAALT